MSDNVIFPDKFAGAARRAGDQGRERDHAAREAERQERGRLRLREIEAEGARFGKKGHIFYRQSDRIAAARAVGTLVRQAKQQFNVKVEKIIQALPGSPRIYRYMLGPDSSPGLESKKGQALLQRVQGYLDIAATVAALTGQDSDGLKIQVLSGTTLWSRASAALEDDDPRAAHLALELNELGRALIRRSGLKELFDRAARIPGVWDDGGQRFTRSNAAPPFPGYLDGLQHWSGTACLFPAGYLDGNEHWSESPPLPSVPLLRCVHAVFPTVVYLEGVGRETPLSGDEAHDRSFDGIERPAWFELSREIRMALGPATSADEVHPMFESRAHVALGLVEPAPSRYELTPAITLKPIDDPWDHVPLSVFQVLIDGLWHRVAMTESLIETEIRVFDGAEYPFSWSANPLDPSSPVLEHWYFSWAAITADSVKHWFDRPLTGNETMVVAQLEGPLAARPVWYFPPSTAHSIEQALASGALGIALGEAIERLRKALNEREAEWKREAAEEHTKRMIAWQHDD